MKGQTWRIGGRVYDHEQLMELKRLGIDPRTGASPKATEKPVSEAQEAVDPVPELSEPQAELSVDGKQPGGLSVPEEIMGDFAKLKVYAKEKGMKLGQRTKKAEILEYLASL